jgi:hypothetical protein
MASAVVLRARVRVRAWSAALTTGFVEGETAAAGSATLTRALLPLEKITRSELKIQ